MKPTLRKLEVHLVFAILIVGHQCPASAGPLRVDINSEDRADMRTIGWENWHPSGDDMSRSFGDVTVTLRAGGNGGLVRL